MRGFIFLLVVIVSWLAACPASADDQQVTDTVDLRVEYVGQGLSLPKKEFQQWVPQELRLHGWNFKVLVLPFSDSAGFHVDTVSTLPPYLLCEYDQNCVKVMVLLRRLRTGYTWLWNSCIFDGYGFIEAKDLNLDGQAEVVTNNIVGVHTFESVFFWQWAGDSLINITPRGCLSGVSDICGSVRYTVTDSGTVIETYPNQDERFMTYFLAKGSTVIRLVKEGRVETGK